MPTPDRRTANRHPQLTADLRFIIGKYALRNPLTDGVVTCVPRDVELRFYPLPGNPSWSGHNGKVCYETAFKAWAAADAINELPGADRVTVYPCPRGGHFHHVSASRRARTIAGIMDQIADAARRVR